ncbi:methionine biosynthesis protein MetW [Commensalibacter nepenthis]|uniref:Methionine biosynthesis protein MetW n=1 Tax=Commensalibacter nepenthis TaxID=3043872 RepID=A0ABT6Q7Q2_9PROT|nr:methionine biosynthesis protein MetW [Commensalibacter sp. TBRC 10068]MDI2112807.1 methionine biosynthesis protein MetW [Commensalibacter sp. TBRC 10068]
MRLDQRCIVEMIKPQSKILDIGCGDGSLIDYLCRDHQCDARGIELDMAYVTQCVGKGLPVIQGNADFDLQHYPTNGFDYVVLSRTLQAVNHPKEVLQQMLRIGRHAIVSFPNFGHWTLRAQLLFKGRMPMTTVWGKYWYETPNIHPCTMTDFVHLCEVEGHRIERWMAIDEQGERAPWRRYVRLANFFGEQALFLLTR